MSDLLAEFRADHVNMSRLLDLLAREVDAFFAGNEPDWAIIESILEYNLSYPDVFHHPKEELVLEKLRLHDADAAKIIGALETEHESLAAEGRRFFAAVRSVMDDPTLPRGWFAGIANEYVSHMRQHMHMEEVIFFPIARQALRAEDWADVEARLKRSLDPLRHSGVEDRFARLRAEILANSTPKGAAPATREGGNPRPDDRLTPSGAW
jgi:hemerythrin-like domain-containing protein